VKLTTDLKLMPRSRIPTLGTQGQATGIQISHATARQQKQQYKSTGRKPTGGKTYALAYVNKNWQKGHANKRNKKDIYIHF
jgi:hypothetical protein